VVAAATVAFVKVAPALSWKIVPRWSVPNDRWPVDPNVAGCVSAKYDAIEKPYQGALAPGRSTAGQNANKAQGSGSRDPEP